MDQNEPPAGQQQQHGGSPAKRKEELVKNLSFLRRKTSLSEFQVMFLFVVQVEKLARLNSRYVAPAGAEKPEAAGKVGIFVTFIIFATLIIFHDCQQVGLAAIRDLAAAQEAALLGKPQPAQGEDEVIIFVVCHHTFYLHLPNLQVTPTNDLHLLRLDPSSNRMTLELGQDGRRPPGRFPLELPASPLSPLRSPLSRVESTR